VFCLFETGGLRHASGDDGGEPGRDRRRAARRGRTGRAIVGMTYYNVFAPLGDPDVDASVDAINDLLESTYTAAEVAVADVAGAFHNGEQPPVRWVGVRLDVVLQRR